MRTHEVHVDAALTNFANQTENGSMLADSIMSVTGVKKESDKYLVVGREEMTLDAGGEDLIGETSEASEFEWTGTWETYTTEPRAKKRFIPQRVLDNADKPWKEEQRTTEKLVNRLRLALEYRVHALAEARVSADSQTTTPSNNWNVAAGTPVLDIMTAKASFRNKTGGLEANAMVVGTTVADSLCNAGDILSKRMYTDPKVMTYGNQLPTPLMGLEVIVPGVFQNTADEGATAAYAALWNDDAFLIHVGKPSLQYDGWGVQFAKGKRFRVRKWREEKRGYGGGMWIQVELNQVEKEINTTAIWELKAVV
jgi:hypothetical protein